MPVPPPPSLAASITWAASKQTYYTIRLLVDRRRLTDAYKAYAYFRWLDDSLDRGEMQPSERIAFVNRQRALVDCCYANAQPSHLTPEEEMLASLIQSDQEPDSGLELYIRHMMAVMTFDARRRGHQIAHEDLEKYERNLAIGVTEALHYFIGHGQRSPRIKARYLAARGAHITHMLRDTLEDVSAGYFNIPCEYLKFHRITPQAIHSTPYKAWVKSRVHQAREYFAAGKAYLAQVQNLRCRMAGYLYMGRFECLLDAIEREGYCLRTAYPERRSPSAGGRLIMSALSQIFWGKI
jgi:phytoene/squalene synthetase